MRRRAFGVGASAVLAASAVSATGESALTKRMEVVQQGDFLLIGNTLAQNCALGTPNPVVGAAQCPAAGVSDLAPDILWNAEAASASANATVTPDVARTTAALKVPAGATVTHAFVFWSARYFSSLNDNSATLECVGEQPLAMIGDVNIFSNDAYHAGSDVTAYVQQNGSCAYRVSGVESTDFKGSNEAMGHSVWWMVVFYSHPKEPHRKLVLHQGLEYVSNGDIASESSITNVLVPKDFAKFSPAKLGVIGYDGDAGLKGDQLLYIKAPGLEIPLQDSAQDSTDFFNSTRSHLGVPVSVAGDLPRLPGTPGSMSHLDMDVVDISALIDPGTTELAFRPASIEPIYLAGLVSSIPMYTDGDADGLWDDAESAEGLDPNDADTDNDGVLDGQEGCSDIDSCSSPFWNQDPDGDGLINALDPDSDNDGLYDGTELGLDCNDPGTDKTLGHCIADEDAGKTTTDPLNADTDSGGVGDGAEDIDLSGAVDSGETDPTSGNGDDDAMNLDSDGDYVTDWLEDRLGSDKSDADSDDDGVLDGFEANFADDTDRDGLPNVIDVDSDNDALLDGTELGSQCDDASTDVSKGHCRKDADPGTRTSMVDADSDNGGVPDGSEDANLNGALDPGELDPTAGHEADDVSATDADADGLSDAVEEAIGLDKSDPDSDDDGVPDGKEANPSNDEDGDGKVNTLDEDSDADGLFDGTEGGYGCSAPGTDKTKSQCIPDGDMGKTTTSMVDPDTDAGGYLDGEEDFDKDGKYEPTAGEGNPLDPSDDTIILGDCLSDHPFCGPADNGKICSWDGWGCIDGCRDELGSGCPEGQVCVFPDPADPIGQCEGGVDGIPPPEEIVVQDGFLCSVPSGSGGSQFGWAVAASAALAAWWRRRARRFE